MADVAHIIASLRKMAEHAVHGASYDQVARAAPMLAEAADTMETLRARVEALEAMVPKKSRKRREAFPPGLDLHLFAEIKAACLRLGRRGPRVTEPTVGMRDDLAKLYAAERPSAEDLTHVVAVREALDRANEGFGELSWEHICRPLNFRRYRDRVRATAGRAKPWTPSDFGEGST